MAKRHYLLFCDESSKRGKFYSYFYGGVALVASDQEPIEKSLLALKEELNLFAELKWTKITEAYADKYIEFIRRYFEFVATGRLKVRIMFCHNFRRPRNLSEQQNEDRYFLLYYQLIKHAFGFRYANPNAIDKILVSVLLDDMPDTKEKVSKFKDYVSSISQTAAYKGTNVFFPKESMAEVNSRSHCILQGLDIILGAMQFRLNDLHKEIPDGERRRGKRTKAKEKVYKEINKLIRQTHPNFNIGASTGVGEDVSNRWHKPYMHWCFVPKEHVKDFSAVKKKAPPQST